MFRRRVALLARAEMCARQRLQDVAEDTEETSGEDTGADVHTICHSGSLAGGRSCARARGAGWGRPTRGLAGATGTAGATGGGGGARLGRAAGTAAAAGTGARLVVGDVEGAAGVLDLRLAVALSDGVVGVGLDAAGKVGLADEVGQGVLVLGEIGGGAVLAETLVGQFLLWRVSWMSWASGREPHGEWQGRTASQSFVGALPSQRVWQPVRSPMHQEAAGERQSINWRGCGRGSRKLTSLLGIDVSDVNVGEVEGGGARGACGGGLGDGGASHEGDSED